MKKYILMAVVCLVALLSKAQNANYRVVFDMSSKDTINQQAIVREIGLIKDASPDAKLEVVIYGRGLDLVLKGKTPQEAAIQKIMADKRAEFKVCAVTMKRNNVDKSMLIPGVEVVPDGIYEIISKQQAGWGYIKVAH